jgi:hypothetical protein
VSKQSDKKQLTPKEIKAIQKRVTLSNRSPNQQPSLEASKTASGSIALMRVKAADGNVLRSSTNGFAKAASRRIWKLFATKQTSTSSEP